MDSELPVLAHRLRELRLGRGWTFKELAKRTGVALGELHMLERGGRDGRVSEPLLSTLAALTSAYRLTLSELVGEVEPPAEPRRRRGIRGGQAFQRRLRRLRKQAGWSYRDLAKHAGIPLGTAHDVENGGTRHHGGASDPHLKTLRALAAGYGLTLSELVGDG